VVATDYSLAHRRLAERLGAESLAHSERVAQTAAGLSAHYGVDVAQARMGGLLHDWDREVGGEGLLSAADSREMPIDATEREAPYLLHARTGARSIREEFGDLPDAVVNAVERHTVGSAEMTDLDMVVFVADMIEPYRSFDGVEDLRAQVGAVPLHALFAAAYQRSVAHLVESRRPIHPDTVGVWNAHVARGRR